MREAQTATAHMALLLRVLHAGGSVDVLLKEGLQFSQIAQLMTEAEERGLAHEEEDIFVLTAAGLELIRTAEGKYRRDGGWIGPQEDARIDRLSIDDIYLPDDYTVRRELG